MKPQQIATLVGLVAAGTAIGIGGFNYNKAQTKKTIQDCNSGDVEACYKVKDKSQILNPDYHYKQKVMKAERLGKKCLAAGRGMITYSCSSERGLDIGFLETVNPELASSIKPKLTKADLENAARKKRMAKWEAYSNSDFGRLMGQQGKKTLMVWRCDDAIRPQLKDPGSFERIDATFVPSVVKEAPGQVVDVRLTFRARNSFGGYAGGFGRCGFDKDAKLVRRPQVVNTW